MWSSNSLYMVLGITVTSAPVSVENEIDLPSIWRLMLHWQFESSLPTAPKKKYSITLSSLSLYSDC